MLSLLAMGASRTTTLTAGKQNAATQKSIDEAGAPDAVVDTITKLIGTKEPKFSNPVGKMTGMILFLQSYAPKMFEGSILKSVKAAT